MSDILKKISEIEERAEKATSGPWRWGVVENMHHVTKQCGPDIFCWDTDNIRTQRGKQHIENNKFIAASRTDIPLLCAIAKIAVEELKINEARFHEEHCCKTMRSCYCKSHALQQITNLFEEQNARSEEG